MKNRLCPIWILILICLCSLPLPSRAADLDESWQALKQAQDEVYTARKQHQDALWQAMEKAFQEAWKAENEKILKKWDRAVRSSRKVWVDYAEGFEARGQVDFEHGRILLEAVVSEIAPHSAERAEQALAKKLETLMGQTDGTGKTILLNQVAPGAKDKLSETMAQSPKTVTGKDGVSRKVYTATVPMVPGHIRIRAGRYLPLVRQFAGENHLDTRLVLAVIHTESCFNPRAVSRCGAVGLMQIIPRFAGRESFQAIFGRDEVKAHDYYFDPAHNIRAGTTYLRLLKTKYFGQIKEEVKNRYVSVCGYNWGPSAMRKNILDVYKITILNDDQVFSLLRSKTPKETQDYLFRVIGRMPIYEAF